MTDYIVDSGNWKVKVSLNDKDYTSPYMEAATQAVEAVFGMKALNGYCEIISLIGEDGRDYFSENYEGVDYPALPMFSILTLVYKIKDLKDHKKCKPFLTSEVFANAAQPINVTLAIKAESSDYEQVKRFKQLQQKLNKQIKKKR
jgi:hypothetical protein